MTFCSVNDTTSINMQPQPPSQLLGLLPELLPDLLQSEVLLLELTDLAVQLGDLLQFSLSALGGRYPISFSLSLQTKSLDLLTI